MDFDWYIVIGIYVLGFVGMFLHAYTIMPNTDGSWLYEFTSNVTASAFLAIFWPAFASWWLFRMLDPR